jgi:hypothetical protein
MVGVIARFLEEGKKGRTPKRIPPDRGWNFQVLMFLVIDISSHRTGSRVVSAAWADDAAIAWTNSPKMSEKRSYKGL